MKDEKDPRLAASIDLAPAMDWAERADRIAASWRPRVGETEIAWTSSGRHLSACAAVCRRAGRCFGRFALMGEQQGDANALGWQLAAPRRGGQVTIDVHAAGAQFPRHDVGALLGLPYPEEALIDGFAGPTFGLECAGIVRAVGTGVDDLAVGDRVTGCPAALSAPVTPAAHAVTRIPDDTKVSRRRQPVPVTFVTAIYALGTLANLQPGRFVLIHAAAGGVGLAAIQYAEASRSGRHCHRRIRGQAGVPAPCRG